jgi:hypothetical protein
MYAPCAARAFSSMLISHTQGWSNKHCKLPTSHIYGEPSYPSSPANPPTEAYFQLQVNTTGYGCVCSSTAPQILFPHIFAQALHSITLLSTHSSAYTRQIRPPRLALEQAFVACTSSGYTLIVHTLMIPTANVQHMSPLTHSHFTISFNLTFLKIIPHSQTLPYLK